ncbi:unnamed protein product, partial [marine sediment metagenome]
EFVIIIHLLVPIPLEALSEATEESWPHYHLLRPP